MRPGGNRYATLFLSTYVCRPIMRATMNPFQGRDWKSVVVRSRERIVLSKMTSKWSPVQRAGAGRVLS